MNYSTDWDGPGEHDDDPGFEAWVEDLQEKVIQGEYGYEP